jgi:DNA mismatch endonuclease Vsr
MEKRTKEQIKKNMQAVKSSGSKEEVMLAKSLYQKGVRYRKNDGKLFGKPDLVLRKYKIVIFVDGEFWHGKDWESRKFDIKSNKDFWIKKIEANIQRDCEVNKKLLQDGWKILRFWGDDIRRNLEQCTERVLEAINETNRANTRE